MSDRGLNRETREEVYATIREACGPDAYIERHPTGFPVGVRASTHTATRFTIVMTHPVLGWTVTGEDGYSRAYGTGDLRYEDVNMIKQTMRSADLEGRVRLAREETS